MYPCYKADRNYSQQWKGQCWSEISKEESACVCVCQLVRDRINATRVRSQLCQWSICIESKPSKLRMFCWACSYIQMLSSAILKKLSRKKRNHVIYNISTRAVEERDWYTSYKIKMMIIITTYGREVSFSCDFFSHLVSSLWEIGPLNAEFMCDFITGVQKWKRKGVFWAPYLAGLSSVFTFCSYFPFLISHAQWNAWYLFYKA